MILDELLVTADAAGACGVDASLEAFLTALERTKRLLRNGFNIDGSGLVHTLLSPVLEKQANDE